METQANTRIKTRRLKRWVRVSLRLLITFGIIFGIYQGGKMLIKELIFDYPAESKEGRALDKSREARLNGLEVNVKWSEDKVISTMHQMTHQKIKASQKWGAVEMTEFRIRELITIVEESNFKQKSYLLTILNRWLEGDFSMVDRDHNGLWDLQGGTVGKATGILTPEEEQTYINGAFR